MKKALLSAVIILAVLLMNGCQIKKTEETKVSTDTQPVQSVEENTSRAGLESESIMKEDKRPSYNEWHILYGHDINIGHIKGLGDSSFDTDEILQMSEKEIKELMYIGNSGHLTPEVHLVMGLEKEGKLGVYTDQLGLTENDLLDLLHLGYTLEEVTTLPADIRDYILPIYKLEDKLQEVGITYFRRVRYFHESEDTSFKELIEIAMSQPTADEFIDSADEKGIKKWEREALLERGYTRKEILDLAKEERNRLLAPGCRENNELLVNYDLLANRTSLIQITAEMKEKGITEEKADTLISLGYKENEIKEISQEELDFIFPTTELREKLNNCGFNNREITMWERRLKYIIRECLGIL